MSIIRLFIVTSIAWLCSPAGAATYYVSFGQTTSALVWADNGWGLDRSGFGQETQQFNFPIGPYQSGDIINFGTLTLGSGPISSNQYGTYSFGYKFDILETYGGAEVFPESINFGSSWADLQTMQANLANAIVPLIYTVGNNGLSVQFGWAYGTYTPPTSVLATADPISAPLPAAWLLYAPALLLFWLTKRLTWH